MFREEVIVKFCVLASGSGGNCALLATARTRILVDAGLSFRALGRRVQEAGETLDGISAVLITHEHSDHGGEVSRLARLLKVPVYVSRLTHSSIPWGEKQPPVECFQAGGRFVVGDIEVDSFSVPHDARDPVGFCFYAEGVKIAVANDLGYLTESVKFHLRRCDLMLLESDYDAEMLKVGPYPWSVKQRVMSRVGHLSNDQVCEFLSGDFDGHPRQLILGHLSTTNNHPEILRLMATEALDRRGLRTPLEIASQTRPSEVYQF